MRAKIVAYRPNGRNTNPLGLGFKAIVVNDNNELTPETYFIGNEQVPLTKGQNIEVDGKPTRIKEVFVKTVDGQTIPLSKVTFPSDEENILKFVNRIVDINTEQRGDIIVAKISKKDATISTNSNPRAIKS